MAKMKINAMTITPASMDDSGQRKLELDRLVKDLKPLMLTPIKQSVHSLSRGINELGQQIKSQEASFSEQINVLQSSFNSNNGISEEQIEGIHADIDVSHNWLNNELNELKKRMQEVESKKPEVVQPKVEHITVHKNHNEEIKQLKHELANVSNVKVVEVKLPKAQNKLNFYLAIGLCLSLLLHLF